MDPTVLTFTLVALVAALVIGGVAWFVMSRRHALGTNTLRGRFGPEYDRAVEARGSRKAGERDLRHRVRAVNKLEIRPLSGDDHARFAERWQQVQRQFVDDPGGAVSNAHDLIKRVMRARGYPVHDFDQRVELLSVDHGNVVQHYRAARTLAHGHARGNSTTEDLRQATVHYRALFDDLLVAPERAPHRALQPQTVNA
jgi:hypothetical protein